MTSKTKTKSKKLKVRAEGKEAFDALFEELSKDGLDVSRAVFDLINKVNKLETEVALLKELMAKALQTNKTNEVPLTVLQD